MKNLVLRKRFIIFLLFFVVASSSYADIVYPAKLQLIEIKPGIFNVSFFLPVQNQGRLNAEPHLPSVCVITQPKVEWNNDTEYQATWQVKVNPNELRGETIGVDGLLGSQIDVILSIITLDGREYNQVLKPAKSSYIIPEAPSLFQLASAPLLEGMKVVFRHVEIFLLFWILVLFRVKLRTIISIIVAGGISFVISAALAQENLLLIPKSLPNISVLLLCAFLIIRSTIQQSQTKKEGVNYWVYAALIGILYGGSNIGITTVLEFSKVEQRIALVTNAIGVLSGLFVLYFTCVECYKTLQIIIGKRFEEVKISWLYKGTAIIAVGLCMYQLSAHSLMATIIPTAPGLYFMVALLVGAYVGKMAIVSVKSWLLIGTCLFIGLIIGQYNFSLPYGTVLLIVIFLLSIGLLVKREFSYILIVSSIVVTVLYAANGTSLFIEENLSKPIAHIVGNTVIAFIVFLVSKKVSESQNKKFNFSDRFIAILGIGAALFIWGGTYLKWINTKYITDYAMGIIDIPALSIMLLVIALIVWPRKSKIAQHLNSTAKKPVAHYLLLIIAVFFLNVGFVGVKNPLFKQDAPKSEQASKILEAVLLNTYTAFNIKDEDKLYNQLAESVGENLIETLYLDSRRRLMSGVRDGAEVTVKKVGVLAVSDPIEISEDNTEFSYRCDWMVIARVKHLLHIHHRQNSYTGILKIKADNGSWKIEQVDLESEDRKVMNNVEL